MRKPRPPFFTQLSLHTRATESHLLTWRTQRSHHENDQPCLAVTLRVYSVKACARSNGMSICYR